MDRNLKDLKLILSSFIYSRDIEDIVFDNNGIINYDPNKCNGKKVILGYNRQAIEENNNNYNSLGRKTGLEKEIFDIKDTRHFSLHYYKPQDNNNSGICISTYYFKEIIVIEEVQVCIRPNPPTYSAVRHYFTPDILLFLKHFHKSQNTKNAMAYVNQNPHFFKHHTMDSIDIIKKAKGIVEELIQQNISNINTVQKLDEKIIELHEELSEHNTISTDTVTKLEQKIYNLEIENEVLKNKITQMENDRLYKFKLKNE